MKEKITLRVIAEMIYLLGYYILVSNVEGGALDCWEELGEKLGFQRPK